MTEEWVTIKKAIERTGMSERTFRRLIKDHKIEVREGREPGKKPILLLDPEKVKSLEGQTMRPVHVPPLPAIVPPHHDKVTAPAKVSQTDIMPFVSGFAEVLVAELAKLPQFQLPALPPATPTKLWLSLKEARVYSGLPGDYLIEQIEAHTIAGFKRSTKGRWHIHRESLERYTAATSDNGKD